jgi:hypothetical protein
MPLRRPFLRFAALRLAAPALALLLASCSSAPAPVVITPPPPPAAPSVALSPKLIEMASAYRGYMMRTTAIAPDFTDGAHVARSLQTGSAYDPNQLVRGAIAYAAVAALQDRTFVEGVRVYAKDRTQRQQMAFELLKDPAYALGLPGAAGAAGLAIAALGGDGQRLYDEGKVVKQSAYDIQKQPWSKEAVADRSQRLAGAKGLASAAMLGDAGETARLQQASTAGGLGLTGEAAAPPYTPTVARGLAIAALAALGEAGDANVETIMGLMNEPNVGRCMSMSKLNLYQCLAVAGPHYEDVFCLGQHAMMDTGKCMIKAAGLPEPYEVRFVPDAKSIAKSYAPPKKPAPKKGRKKS